MKIVPCGSIFNVVVYFNCRMNLREILQYITIKALNEDNIPHRIRGRVMHLFSECPSVLISTTNGRMHVGQDKHSCTTSAAALAFWLTHSARTLHELAAVHSTREVSFSTLTSDEAVTSLIQSNDNSLFVFSTRHHKFTVLRIGTEAVLLQSNQDDTRGGHRFTLSEWIQGGDGHMSLDALAVMIRQLALAAVGKVDHESVFATYFGGARFKRGDIDDYWVIVLPITLVA